MFGVLLLLFVAGITDYTVLLLIKDGILAKTFTYQVKSESLTPIPLQGDSRI